MSPQSMAWRVSRSRCARQTCQAAAWPRWLPSISDTHTAGLIEPNSVRTTALPRLGRITCSTERVPTNTHSHQVLPFTRTDVSSEQTTLLASTVSWIVAAAASSGVRARKRILLIEPSLIDSANTSPQPRQALHADGMGVVQIHYQRRDRATKRRTGLQSGRSLRRHALAAAGAAATEPAHARHIRLDRRKFDPVVDLLRTLRGVGERSQALRAVCQRGIDNAIRVRMQRATHSGAALARWTPAVWL